MPRESNSGLNQPEVIVVGTGEVGKPLARILARTYECAEVDVASAELDGRRAVLHICYPFQIGAFVQTTADYIHRYTPQLTIINSTVPPGTTRAVQELIPSTPVIYSPVRGKHARMESDLLKYKKFIAGFSDSAVTDAIDHFRRAGFKTDRFRTTEIAELSKLIETTALGVLIAWAQEVQRFANTYSGTFDEINEFIKEIDFLPSHVSPGHIGGHCVMPNIALLQEKFDSTILDAVVDSNRRVASAACGAASD